MRIKEIEICNILSIESGVLSFDDSGLVLVEGWNHDDQRANGAGKTAIFNSLSFGLYDKIPRKITASEILRKGTKTGYVKVILDIAGETWTVKRSRPKGVEFYLEDKKQEISQEEWEQKLRFNYTQFLLSMYNPQNSPLNLPRFLLSNDADKKSFLLALMNLDSFSECKKSIEDDLKKISYDIDSKKSTLHALISKKEAFSFSLINKDELHIQNLSLQEEIEGIKSKLKSCLDIKKPDVSKYIKLDQDAQAKLSNIYQAKAKYSLLMDEHKAIDRKLSTPSSIKRLCSECGTELSSNSSHLDSHKENLKSKQISIKEELDSLSSIVAKEDSIKKLRDQVRSKKDQELIEYNSAQSAINSYKHSISAKDSQLQNNLDKIASNDQLLSKINEIAKLESSISNDIDSLSKKLELNKILSSIFSPTGAQAYILDSLVESFNDSVLEYILKVWPNVTYQLLSSKENSKGESIAKFSELLVVGGHESSVGSLSGGEQKALSLCVDFAILDVIKHRFNLDCNPIILDEPFDGLDTAGRELVIGLLDKLSKDRQIFVIDHASEAKSLFSKVLSVEKRNDISTIKQSM